MPHHPPRTVAGVIPVVYSNAAALPALRLPPRAPRPAPSRPRALGTARPTIATADVDPGDCPRFGRWWLWALSLEALDSPAGPGVALCLL